MLRARHLAPLSRLLPPRVPCANAYRMLCSASTNAVTSENVSKADDGKVETVLKMRVAANAVPDLVRKALSTDNMSRSEVRASKLRDAVRQFRRSDQDTGSPEVQIALWTVKIRDLTEHVTTHRKDKENVRRLVMMVHKRRRMMRYLLRESPERYRDLVGALGLRPGSVFGRDVTRGAKKAATPTLHLHG